jgi:hypothetical protein
VHPRISLEKLCGIKLFENEPPFKYVGLIKQNNIFYFLYSSMQPKKFTEIPERIIVERGFISTNHPPKDMSKFSHLLMNCGSKNLTLSQPTTIENLTFKADDISIAIEMPNQIISEYLNDKCLLNDVPTMQTKPLVEASIPPKRVEALTFEKASEKCSDIGFTIKTEAFGKCVLQLTN